MPSKHPLAQVREITGLTQARFATMLGITRGYLSHVESHVKPVSNDLAAKVMESCGAWIPSGRIDKRKPGVPIGLGPNTLEFHFWAEAENARERGAVPVFKGEFRSEKALQKELQKITKVGKQAHLIEHTKPRTSPFDEAAYDWWLGRKSNLPKQTVADMESWDAGVWVRVLLNAAARANRLGPVRVALGQAMRKLADDFNLGRDIAQVLKPYCRLHDGGGLWDGSFWNEKTKGVREYDGLLHLRMFWDLFTGSSVDKRDAGRPANDFEVELPIYVSPTRWNPECPSSLVHLFDAIKEREIRMEPPPSKMRKGS